MYFTFNPVHSQPPDVFNQNNGQPNDQTKATGKQNNSDGTQKENIKKWFEFKNSVTNASQLNLKISQSEDFRIVLPQYSGSQPVYTRTDGGIVGETG